MSFRRWDWLFPPSACQVSPGNRSNYKSSRGKGWLQGLVWEMGAPFDGLLVRISNYAQHIPNSSKHIPNSSKHILNSLQILNLHNTFQNLRNTFRIFTTHFEIFTTHSPQDRKCWQRKRNGYATPPSSFDAMFCSRVESLCKFLSNFVLNAGRTLQLTKK